MCPRRGIGPAPGDSNQQPTRSPKMNTRCEAVDWWNWGITEAASQVVDFFKMGVAFLAGRFSSRTDKTPERTPLYIRGTLVGGPPKLSGRLVLVERQMTFNFE